MLSDVGHSIQLLVWRDEDSLLTLLSRDFDNVVCMSTSFINDGTSMGLLLGDNEGNVEMLQFNPRKAESRQGSRLLTLADFHVGSDVSVQIPHPSLSVPPGIPNGLLIESGFAGNIRTLNDSRVRRNLLPINTVPFGTKVDKCNNASSCVTFGTLDGGLGLFIPIDERIYRRLALLQQIMGMGIESCCGLNPREHRIIKTVRYKAEKKRGILDGDLLWRFATLDIYLQNELAAAMGTTSDMIMENLQEIDILASFF
jgi:cleavage and polyadenylation specificity factor subunit 1